MMLAVVLAMPVMVGMLMTMCMMAVAARVLRRMAFRLFAFEGPEPGNADQGDDQANVEGDLT